MNNIEIQDTVKNTVITLINKFNKSQCKDAFVPKILFTKRGKCAGCVSYESGSEPVINFNMTLLKENLDDFIKQVVPHEVAHFTVYIKYGHQRSPNGKRIIHGIDWKDMMSFFGVNPERCHSYNTSNSSVRKMKTFSYKCDCRIHELTKIRHNKIIKGTASYCCGACKSKLVKL